MHLGVAPRDGGGRVVVAIPNDRDDIEDMGTRGLGGRRVARDSHGHD